MVFLHALIRGADLFGRRLQTHSSHFLTSLCTSLKCQRCDALESRLIALKGLYQLQKTDYIVSNPFTSSPYTLKPSLVHTAACDSVESLHEQIESAGREDKTRESADVFREWGCSETDISKIFERRPSLRKTDIQILQSKLEILSHLGIKSADLVKMVHCRPRFLNCKINVLLNERLEYLEAIFGSRELLVKAIVRNPSLLTYDFHNKIKPVIAVYESDHSEKVMNMEKYGLPEDEICSLIGRSPLVLTLSIDKVQRHMTFILGTMKLTANVVLRNPFLLYFNLETVLKPRFKIACKIEDMGLSPQVKGPSLLRALRMSEKRFISAFVTCHPANVAEELITAYTNAKCVKRLAESSKKNSHKGFPF
ncbi:hypothetical protein DH2020_048126 [Rehmannia glutinosa]|uniref:Uncharacterized protein n=1 Tax=Rehmannia glutinosa TaxID=99300 RepID=A0ABR0U6X3_REHGL